MLAKPSDAMVAKDDAALKDIFKAGNDESLDIFVMVLLLSCMKWENDGKMQSHFLHIKACTYVRVPI